jgi:hypothetical protein
VKEAERFAFVQTLLLGYNQDKATIGDSAMAAGRKLEEKMEIHELIIEMKLLERRLTLYEEKYGVLSEDFYTALMAGKLARYDAYDETRADFSRWKGIYETWRRRKEAYTEQIQQRELVEALRVQPAY